MHVRVEHVQDRRFVISGQDATAVVDRLEERGGPGDGMRPVELLLGALGACMLGTMMTFARNREIPVDDVAVELSPTIAEHPERVERVDVVMHLTGDLTDRQVRSLERVAARCKIHNTLHAGADTSLTIEHAAAVDDYRVTGE
jgi:putative redox protein